MNADLRRPDCARPIIEPGAAVRSDRIDRICTFAGIAPFAASFTDRPQEAASCDVRPDDTRPARAREILAPGHEPVAARFGEALPAAWRGDGAPARPGA